MPTKPSDYITDTTLDEFFARDPKLLTDEEIDKIIAVNRDGYKAWAADERKKKKKHSKDDDVDLNAPLNEQV